MSGNRSRLVSLVTVAAGTLAYSFGQWLILIMLTRQAGETEVGLFSLALAVSAPISLLAGMSLRTVYLTDVDAGRSFLPFFTLRLAGSALTLLVSLGYALVTGTLGTIFVAVVVCKALDLLADICCAPWQERGLLWRVGLQTGLNGVVSAACVGLCIYVFHTTPEVAVLASIIGSAVALASVVPTALLRGKTPAQVSPAKERSAATPPPVATAQPAAATQPGGVVQAVEVQPDYDERASASMLSVAASITKVAWPLGVAAMLVSLLANVPRYVLKSFATIEAVGVFSAVAYLTVIGSAVVGALAQLLLPRLVATHKSAGFGALERAMLLLAAGMAVVGLAVMGVGSLIASPLLTILYGQAYNQPAAFVILLGSWALGSVSWMYDLGLSTRRQFQGQLVSSALALVVAVVASLLLVPGHGVVGAAWAAVAASAMQLLTRAGLFHLAPQNRAARPSAYVPRHLRKD